MDQRTDEGRALKARPVASEPSGNSGAKPHNDGHHSGQRANHPGKRFGDGLGPRGARYRIQLRERASPYNIVGGIHDAVTVAICRRHRAAKVASPLVVVYVIENAIPVIVAGDTEAIRTGSRIN